MAAVALMAYQRPEHRLKMYAVRSNPQRLHVREYLHS